MSALSDPHGVMARRFGEFAVARHLHVSCESIVPGGGVFVLDPPAELRNPNGGLSGAIILGALDSVASAVAMADNPEQDHVSTTDVAMQFLRPSDQLPLRLLVEVLRLGRRSVVVHVRVQDRDEVLVAAGSVSMVIHPGTSTGLAPVAWQPDQH